MVIEDAAHALGADYKGKRIGSLSDMTIFSFHPVKHITTGEGGMITTNNEELYEKLLLFRTHGITRKRELFESADGGPWYYDQVCLGYNYRITDIQCALGLSQLKKSDKFLSRRREIADIYNSAFEDLDGVVVPFQKKDRNSSWHLYVVKFDLNTLSMSRRKIYDFLISQDIGVNVHYIPVYYLSHYKKLGYKKGICKNAEKLYEEIITLPLYPKMNDEDVEYVINAVKKVVL
jgi:dTDP-4-amino-4,6-dideoxygalactose transaminase